MLIFRYNVMRSFDFHGSYFIRINIPLLLVLVGLFFAVFYFPAAKMGGHRKTGVYIAVALTLLWAVSSLLSAWRMPRASQSDELLLFITSCIIALIVIGVTVLGMKLRVTLALAISLLCASAWFLLVWLSKTGG